MNEKQRLQYTAQIETDHPTDKNPLWMTIYSV